MSQRSFASAEYAMKKKRTKREKFLAELERIAPWEWLIAVIESIYPNSGRVGRPPIGDPQDAAHVLLPAVVRAGRRGTGRRPL